ncbi:hypothetical protein VKT23_017647 [Stygiomarasmius scandens]|uniref:Uncharacterized protein n=1 Tax=Marasmiellus scandens TaxID=2682957 RepID=A0ABR1IRC2_9AGAR
MSLGLDCEVLDMYPVNVTHIAVEDGIARVLVTATDENRQIFDQLVGQLLSPSLINGEMSILSGLYLGCSYTSVEFIITRSTQFSCMYEATQGIQDQFYTGDNYALGRQRHLLYEQPNPAAKAITSQARITVQYHDTYDAEQVRSLVADHIEVFKSGINWTAMPTELEPPEAPLLMHFIRVRKAYRQSTRLGEEKLLSTIRDVVSESDGFFRTAGGNEFLPSNNPYMIARPPEGASTATFSTWASGRRTDASNDVVNAGDAYEDRGLMYGKADGVDRKGKAVDGVGFRRIVIVNPCMPKPKRQRRSPQDVKRGDAPRKPNDRRKRNA